MKNETLRIPITQKHIDDGVQGAPGECAFALALQEATGRGTACTGFTTCLVRTDIYDLSDGAQQFVNDFDHGRAEPQTVTIQLQGLN